MALLLPDEGLRAKLQALLVAAEILVTSGMANRARQIATILLTHTSTDAMTRCEAANMHNSQAEESALIRDQTDQTLNLDALLQNLLAELQ